MKPRAFMLMGTGSDVGKSLVAAGLCRAFAQRGIGVDGHRQRTTVRQRRAAAPATPQGALRHGQ